MKSSQRRNINFSLIVLVLRGWGDGEAVWLCAGRGDDVTSQPASEPDDQAEKYTANQTDLMKLSEFEYFNGQSTACQQTKLTENKPETIPEARFLIFSALTANISKDHKGVKVEFS